MITAIATTEALQLDAAISDAWRDFARGVITENEVEHRVTLLAAQRLPGRPSGAFAFRQLRGISKFAARRPQRSPDREASRHRRRMLARDGRMPPAIRAHYTEGEAAALTIIPREHKRQGYCDLCIDRIAAEAGVSRTTVQNAVRKAVRLGHMSKEERPVKGQKSKTNIIRIISREWLTSLQQGPRIGFKSFLGLRNLRPTNTYLDDGDEGATEKRGTEGVRITKRLGDAAGVASRITEATEIAERLGNIAGIASKRAWPPGWCGVELHVRNWLARGWGSDAILAASRATMARKPEPGPPCSPAYFAPEIARLYANLARPIVIRPAHPKRIAQSRGGSLRAATVNAKTTLVGI
jgi:hypothetical protein